MQVWRHMTHVLAWRPFITSCLHAHASHAHFAFRCHPGPKNADNYATWVYGGFELLRAALAGQTVGHICIVTTI